EARRGPQGLEPLAAGPRRRARPHRRAHIHAAGRGAGAVWWTAVRRLAILGSTGSVGANTLDVVARHPGRFEIVALTAGKNDALLLAQCKAHRPQHAVMADPDAAER